MIVVQISSDQSLAVYSKCNACILVRGQHFEQYEH